MKRKIALFKRHQKTLEVHTGIHWECSSCNTAFSRFDNSFIQPCWSESSVPDWLQHFFQFDDLFLVLDGACDMVVHGEGLANLEATDLLATKSGRFAWMDPILCKTSCVRWRTVLPENEPCGQQSSAVFDEITKKTIDIISTVVLWFLNDKMRSTLATETRSSRYHQMLRKLFTLDEETSEMAWHRLSCQLPRICCFDY